MRDTLKIPYGKTSLEFTLPASMQVDMASSSKGKTLPDAVGAIQEALSHPVGAPPISMLAKPGMKVCIVFTDITRDCPDHLLVPALLTELGHAGVREEDVTLLCGIGMHRPSTLAERKEKLGLEVVNRFRVLDHEPRNPAVLADLGKIAAGVNLQVHQAVTNADLVLSTGIVEPHQYAGYSGGRKTVAIGAAGEAFIAYTHGTMFVENPGTRLGRVQGNPFHEVISEASHRAGLRFILNAVMDEERHIMRVAAGEPSAAFMDLVSFARSVYEVPIKTQYDVAIAGVGYPKDGNLYQASRAASYLHFAPTPVVRPGGFIIIPARCEEGAGQGIGEQRFLAGLRDAPDIQSVLENARKNGYPPGQQRAFVMAKVLENVKVIIVASEYPDLVAACKMIPAPTMEEALALIAREMGSACRVLIIPHALLTLPVVEN